MRLKLSPLLLMAAMFIAAGAGVDLAKAATCPGTAIKNALIKDSSGFLESPTLTLQQVNFTGAGLPSATLFQNMITPGGNVPTSFNYVGIKDSAYTFRWPQSFLLDSGTVKIYPPAGPGGTATGVAVQKYYGYIVTIPSTMLTTGTDGTNITATLKKMQWFTGNAGADLGEVTDNSAKGECTLSVNANIGAELQASVKAKAAGGVGIGNQDVGGTLTATDDSVDDDYGGCGKPKLNASIFTYAFCNLLLSFVDLLKYFLP